VACLPRIFGIGAQWRSRRPDARAAIDRGLIAPRAAAESAIGAISATEGRDQGNVSRAVQADDRTIRSSVTADVRGGCGAALRGRGGPGAPGDWQPLRRPVRPSGTVYCHKRSCET
jgi:hypothetical protein